MAEVLAAKVAALRPDEDEAPLPRFGEPVQVPPDLRGDLGGERDGALTGARLWRVRTQPALVELGECFRDPDLACLQVDVLAAKPGQFAPPHVREGGEQHQGAVTHRNGLAISKTTGSGTICRSSDSSLPAPSMWHGLRGMMRSSSAAVSKMACNRRYALATVTGPNGRFAFGPASRRSLRQRLTRRLIDVAHAEVAERRIQVIRQEPVIEFDRPGLEHAVAHPLLGVLAERLLAQFRGDPLPLRDLGFLEAQPASGIGLALEGDGSRTEVAVRPPVPRLISSRWKLADVAELSAFLLGAWHQATSPLV